jgi:AraC-like DNA-binding protein
MASTPDFRRKASTPAHVSHGKRVPQRPALSAANAIRLNYYRGLARKQWSELPLALFRKLTGVKLHVRWTSKLPPWTSGEDKHTSSFTHQVVVNDKIVGMAFLQVLGKKSKTRKRPAEMPSSRSTLNRAAALLGLFVGHVEMASHLKLTKADLARERLRAAEHEHEKVRLRDKLSRVLPGIRRRPVIPQHESHTEQIVQRLLDSIHKDYPRPLGLKECAASVGLNPVYLCSLFSRTVGIPFKTYLTELRIEKAKQLLSDPSRRISDVAYAVGYTDPNRFRLAFKAATGIPPATWRSALRIHEPHLGNE